MTPPAAPPARLLALRLQGFKSFAERTTVEFGGGISAIVGPNGSGKSNLADGLRWALGEQGRALRSRRSEDVIWAGSDRRAALGMADVTLSIDNSDGLLPVDFQVLELGRRLYRSGENDYLLNRQRVRLRDLVDLLDAAHLADNAFLFIGQGMVDQALALRPEERRPLFEEVAGVRRHERRRRKAEDQLAESEANLARIEDVLAELRPQARRLAAQAEQQTTRDVAAEELAAALLLSGHARWYEAAGRVAEATTGRDAARLEADAAMSRLAAAEEVAAAIATGLGARSAVERERREAHESVRTTLLELQLRDGRLAADLEAIDRDRERAGDERAAADADLARQRRILAEPVPSRDLDLESALGEAERSLADALAELGGLREVTRTHGEQQDAMRRATAVRAAEAETARRRLREAEVRLTEETTRLDELTIRHAALEAEASAAAVALAQAIDAEQAAATQREAARARAEEADGAHQAISERSAAARATLAAVRGRSQALATRLAEEEARGIARAARRHGGRRLDDDLVVDPGLRSAVETALSGTARAYLVAAEVVPSLAGERGELVVGERTSTELPLTDPSVRRFRDHVAALGGGALADSIRRDPTGAVRMILARAAWLPDLTACLEVQASLPPGWVAIPRDGSALVTEMTVELGDVDPILERRAEATHLAAEVVRLEADLAELDETAAAAAATAEAGQADLRAARSEEAASSAARRSCEEAERRTSRALENVVRETAWHRGQADRIGTEVAQRRDALATIEASLTTAASELADDDPTSDAVRAIATWETRAQELRARRDRLAGQASEIEGRIRSAEGRRARAEATASMDEDRIVRADREVTMLAERERRMRDERDELKAGIAAAVERERHASEELAALRAADAADREGLAAAERDTTTARERLRIADERARAGDHAEVEARVGLDALREQLLVELAGLGDLGIQRLEALARSLASDGTSPVHVGADLTAGGSEVAALEAAVAIVAPAWAAAPPSAEPPGPARLAQLRRRYHELGTANPFAVEEYAELRTRLETLESQRTDLVAAIVRTRELIEELRTMVAEQFRSTFRALEVAFRSRFIQLFGGGDATLSLTDPNDLAATGVEIVARPPGKKAQALAMLSGGERALTAVALLFAMLQVRPVPFCVLDEVDAALDEANIGRFTDALRDLAERTQFIVITHNRGTIEAADALYGVTVGDDSVSRVISLRLDEARALADDGRDVLVRAG